MDQNSSRLPPWPSPLAIAHRAGNELATLRRAERAGVDLIEADIWLYRDRLEVRHLKTMGMIPLLWDRWRLAPAWTPRLGLGELLAAMDAVAEPMLDLKGAEPRAAEAVLALVEQVRPGRPFTVCSQQWPVLQPFQGVATARVVYSIGNAGQLRRALRYLVGRECAGVAIHQRLLTAETVTALLGVAPRILTWPVNTPARLQELLARGVDGIISDSLPLLQRLVQQRARAEEQRTPLIRAADR